MRSPAFLLAALCACSSATPGSAWPRKELWPDPNPLVPGDPLWSPQPDRARPRSIAVTPDGRKAYVALGGREDAPGTQVAVIDVGARRLAKRVRVGRSPWAVAVHPGGRFAVVLLRYASWAAVIDTRSDEVVAEVPVPYYTEGIAFAPDGKRAWLANRWKDSVLRWELSVADRFEVRSTSYDGLPLASPMGIPVATNPRALALSADGSRLFAGAIAGVSVSVIDTAAEKEIARLHVNGPAIDLAVSGGTLYVATTGQGSGHRPDEGFDGDRDGAPGDGTANVMFQDLQNEIWAYDVTTLERTAFYTSDTICCRDFRDVDPGHPERGAALPPPDPWPASRIGFLPPRERWVVAGSLPEALAVLPGPELWVAFSASAEVQGFRAAGELAPMQVAGGLFRTAFNPVAMAAVPGTRMLLVAERLSDSVAFLDVDAGPSAPLDRVSVATDPAAAPFPATDAELGEAFNFGTAPFTVDGDQSCAHCHRDGGNLEKSVAMPLQVSPAWGTRQVMAYRGAFDTRPWFFETAMREDNFFPVINEFSRKENFCCEGLDPLIFSHYPAARACTEDPTLEGCTHVLHCEEDPPPECALRGYGISSAPTRARFFSQVSLAVLGRDHAFGDVLRDGEGRGLPLDFDGITRAVGLFLLREPRFLPDPNREVTGEAGRRGRLIFERPDVGCSACHPLPTTTPPEASAGSGVPLRFPPVITPLRTPEGLDADQVVPGFIATFPMTVQSEAGVHFGASQLRGIWDRGSAFFHDGRARSLREALATPGHPALLPGESGFNERDGQPNTHGATSQLTPSELADLAAFLLTL